MPCSEKTNLGNPQPLTLDSKHSRSSLPQNRKPPGAVVWRSALRPEGHADAPFPLPLLRLAATRSGARPRPLLSYISPAPHHLSPFPHLAKHPLIPALMPAGNSQRLPLYVFGLRNTTVDILLRVRNTIASDTSTPTTAI